MLVIGQIVYHSSFDYGIVCDLQPRTVQIYFKDKRKRTFVLDLRNDSSYIRKVNEINIKQVIELDLIEGLFDSSTKSKGNEYFRISRVRDYHQTSTSISANILGTYDYYASIFVEHGIVHLTCNCPVKGNCKHLYALYLHAKSYKYEITELPDSIIQYSDRLAKFPKYDWELLDNLIYEIDKLNDDATYFEYLSKYEDEDFLRMVYFILYSSNITSTNIDKYSRQFNLDRNKMLLLREVRNNVERNKYDNPYYNHSSADHLLHLLSNHKYQEMFNYLIECAKYKHLFRYFDDELNALNFILEKLDINDDILDKYIDILKAFNKKDIDITHILKRYSEDKIIDFCSKHSDVIKIDEELLQYFSNAQLIDFYVTKNDIENYLSFIDLNKEELINECEGKLVKSLIKIYFETNDDRIKNYIASLEDSRYLLEFVRNVATKGGRSHE